MRILVLSDIHANLEALEACLESAPAFDRVFNLGDLVGYGANPNEAADRSRQLGNILVRGNHDKACSGISSTEGFNSTAALAVEWTHNQLTQENLEFLQTLPQGPIEPLAGVECVHGSVRDEDEYVTIARDAYGLLSQSRRPITFFGHTHIQCGYCWDKQTDLGQTLAPNYQSSKGKQEFQIHLRADTAYMLNPGSVGQPRDNDSRAAFIMYDSEENAVTFCRVPYDIATAQQKIRSSGLPGRLAERLAEGR